MRHFVYSLFALAAVEWPLRAQRASGELRLEVVDSTGAGLQAGCALTSQSAGVKLAFRTSPAGRYTAKPLPFGPFHLHCERPGFSAASSLVEIQSEIPRTLRITLGVAAVETTIVVRDEDTLLDPQRTGSLQQAGSELLSQRRSAAPGRGVLEMVNTQPGWLLEANGVLHPRGSEYDVQYVIDGVPLYDNRSPGFAQSLGIEEFQSMKIMTGGYPAEFGRRLGGVIEVVTNRESRPGFHAKAALEAGSFEARKAFVSGQYTQGRTTAGLSAEGFLTARYLDPPVEENFTNHGSGAGFSGRLERDWTGSSRTRFYMHHRQAGFLVPNENLQQTAGQRQDRAAMETMGLVSHQQVLSPSVVGHFRLMGRDTSALLWSNSLSTPIQPVQNRGFREFYGLGSLLWNRGRHEWKAGVEAIRTSIRERFAFRITEYEIEGKPIFDENVPATFRFQDQGHSREQSAFVQDLIRLGRLTLSAGLRWDHYQLRVNEHGLSPRLAAAWHVPSAGLLIRACYDRAFQPPAVENVLLASSNLVRNLGGEGFFFPLRPSRGHFYEAGFSKSIFSKLRMDGVWYRRQFRNFADDSLLFNTGVSFPIAFDRAVIRGYEAKLEIPRWGRVSGYASYSNMTGHGYLPVGGGMFLGEDADRLLAQGSFAITQDQRNTARARVRAELHRRLWTAWGGGYNSGLPVEMEGVADHALLESQYGEQILNRVNFSRGRVRPSFSLDASAGWDVWNKEARAVRLQFDALNLTNRLNVINFTGLFSGTALEPRRSFALRLEVAF
ncbi:MAG: TonB-dependent receptor [Acidobacteria bacterium]|nr:TonB-dependent receptor [Acidobacteriota bacterium]